MTGPAAGSLHVTRQLSSSGGRKERVWSESGNRGEQWRRTRVHIGTHQDFVLSIEAHRGMQRRKCFRVIREYKMVDCCVHVVIVCQDVKSLAACL